MENEEKKTENSQNKSHRALLKLLNNIGVVGAILAAIADIVFVLIFVFGVKIDVSMSATIIFAVVNALIGVLINGLLRYQGLKYAQIENEDTLSKYYIKKMKESKKPISMSAWLSIKSTTDVLMKFITTAFSICGLIYISIEGSKNPIQILITVVTLILFACFGLISMNSAYCRFYNVQLPYIKNQIQEKEKQ